MTPTVLDAHALMAYLEEEPGARRVTDLFVEALECGVSLLMTSVNVGEVLYIALREYGPERFEQAEAAIADLPIDIVSADLPLARQAARFKAAGGLSYADCFAAALAKLREGRVVTGDPEFQTVEDEIEILWIP